jgi:lysophospholipase L1-like esterase
MPWWFDDEVRGLEARTGARRGESDLVLFYGSSSFTLWPDFEDYFPGYRVLNHGFGGSTLADCVEYFDRLVAAYRPRVIVLYAGDNDLGNGGTPEQVLATLEAFVARKRAALDGVPMAYVSIKVSPARFGIMHRIGYTNRILERWLARQPDVRFVDITRRMTGRGLVAFMDYYSEDDLHMNRAGYRVLGKSITEYLQAIAAAAALRRTVTAVRPAWMDQAAVPVDGGAVDGDATAAVAR